jgi:hypothetical protein
MMALQLEAPKADQGNKTAYMQAVGGWIEACVERQRRLSYPRSKRLGVGAIRDQAAPLEFFQNVHLRRLKGEIAISNRQLFTPIIL